MQAGDLNRRVAFDAPALDASGVQTGWTGDALACWAHIRYLRGGETVQAARLEGQQPIVATIRNSAAAQAVDTGWRMRDTGRGVTYNVRSVVPTEDRAFLELTCESGVAT